MKLKNAIAIVVVLAMLLANLSAFTLIASAAEASVDTDVTDADIVEYAKTNGYVFNAQKTTTTQVAGSGKWPSLGTCWPDVNWTVEQNSASVWVMGEMYNPSLTFRTVNTYKNPSKVTFNENYGEGNSYVIFSFVPGELAYNYGDVALVDIDGNLITAFRLDKSDAEAGSVLNVGWGHTGYASPFRTFDEATQTYVYNGYAYTASNDVSTNITSGSSQIDILVKKVDDSSYQAIYFVDGTAVTTFTYGGTFNGLGGIWGCPTGATGSHTNMSLTNPAIYVGDVPSCIAYVTASYRYNVTGDDNVDEIVYTAVKGYDAGNENSQGAWFDEYYYSALGSHLMYKVPGCYLLADNEIDVIQKNPDTKVVLTRVPNWSHDTLQPSDLYVDEKTNKTYMVATRNLIPNGNFGYGLNAWYNGTGAHAEEKNFDVNEAGAMVKFMGVNNTSTSESGLYRKWDVTPGETYVFRYTSSADCSTGVISETDDIDNKTYAGNNILGYVTEGTHDIVFEATANYVQFNLGWFKDKEVGNFGLYKLEIVEPGDVRTTVIEGNAPVLPATVALGEDGVVSEVTWDETKLNSLELGLNLVAGTVADSDETVTAYVMVYPETFSLEDQVSRNGQKAVRSTGDVPMPQDITGKFAIEMDVEVSEYGDIWIIFNDSTILNNWYFHNDQILLGFYVDGEITPINGHGDGNRDDQTTLTVAGIDKNYRVFVKGDCDTDKYTVTVTTPDGMARTFEDFGFRMNADKLNSLAVFTNSDGTGSLTVKNIKVYDPEDLNAQYILENGKVLGEENIGDYFYDEEITFYDQAKFYTSYTDEEKGKDMGHIVKSTMKQTFVVDPTMTPEAPLPVYVKMHKEHAVVYDTFATDNEAELTVAENLLFAGANGVSDAPDVDDDNVATVTGGGYVASPRIPLLTFNIPYFNEGNVVMLNLYVYRVNHNIGEGESMKLAVNAVDTVVDESMVYAPADVASLENLIWTDKAVEAASVVENDRRDVTADTHRMAVDVTDLVMKAKAEGKEQITFAVYTPTAGAYIVNRESAVYGGVHQGDTAAFLEIENDTYTIDVLGADSVTKNGSKVQLEEDGVTKVIIRDKATMRLYAEHEAIVAFVDDDNTYVYKEDKVVKPYASSSCVRPVALGLSMVNGAQVRYGDKVDENGKVGNGNGLRFITTIDHADTLADFVAQVGADGESLEYVSDSFTMGALLKADGVAEAKEVVARKLQNSDVYTTAITKLAESNYNRNYSATPYIKIEDDFNGDEIYVADTSVTRSVYSVATGILRTHDISEENADDYSLTNEDLLNVLRAYVNQVGIRLSYNPDAEETFSAREEGSGAYANSDAFFDVSYTDNGDGSYTVVIAPMADYNTPVEIKDWWKDYVRVNNNNSKVRTMITDDFIDENGTLTFRFVVTK